MKSNYRKLIYVILCLVIILVVFPYIKVEFMTAKFGDEFKDLYTTDNILSKIEYMKVLDYTDANAEIYYVSKGKKAGLIYFFERSEEGIWQLTSWDAVWSKNGSADKFMWPYYR